MSFGTWLHVHWHIVVDVSENVSASRFTVQAAKIVMYPKNGSRNEGNKLLQDYHYYHNSITTI